MIFDEALAAKTRGIKGLRFVVNSGVNNFASCAEMVFYAEKKTPLAITERTDESKSQSFLLREHRTDETELYSVTGEKLNTDLPLMPGIYLVKAGEKVSKVLVR